MRETKKHRKKKHKSKRLGRGIEDKVPLYLKEMLNATSLRSNKQTFNEPGIVSQILQDVPRESVTLALENADYKKEVEDLLSNKFKRSANSRAIANKIANAIPITDLTYGRKKQTLLKKLKIAQKALDAHILDNKSIDDNKEELFNKLGVLEAKLDELEEAFKYPKLDNYDNLRTKYDKLIRSQSMLKRSSAPLIGIRLQTLRYGPNRKLYALKDKLNVAYRIYDEAYKDYTAAHNEEDRLFSIVYNLKEELEELEDL